VTRAALVTLVVVVRGDRAATEATAMIAQITVHAPCRAILVNLREEEGAESVSAWVSAHCHRVSGGRQVCCEQITVAAGPDGVAHVPAIVVPLLIPDMPVFVHWPGYFADAALDGLPSGNAGIRALASGLREHADYIVFDSARSDDPARTVGVMAALMNEAGLHAEPRDLNWSRLNPWREAVADLFEPADFRGWITELESIRIESSGGMPCDDGAACPLRPLLLLSWVTGRLGWKRSGGIRKDGGFRLTWEGGREARVLLGQGDETRGSVRSLDFHFRGGRRIRLERAAPDRFEAHITGAGHEMMKNLPRILESEESLLCAEIDRRGQDPVWRAVLSDVAALVEEAEE
jgi:glucose-6-phosphate dehydrogenase assembly protein OpcA